MTEEVKLYDFEAQDHPREVGTTFRSIQVFRCPICRAVTNQIEVIAWPYRHRRVCPVCPDREEHWHINLRQKLQLLSQPHPASYRFELMGEILTLRENHTHDDLEGYPDLSSEAPISFYFIPPDPPIRWSEEELEKLRLEFDDIGGRIAALIEEVGLEQAANEAAARSEADMRVWFGELEELRQSKEFKSFTRIAERIRRRTKDPQNFHDFFAGRRYIR